MDRRIKHALYHKNGQKLFCEVWKSLYHQWRSKLISVIVKLTSHDEDRRSSTNKASHFSVILEVFEAAPSFFMVDIYKAIQLNSSRYGMTRASVMRFGSVKRAAELKFYMENLVNFETFEAISNKYVILAWNCCRKGLLGIDSSNCGHGIWA
ncbi:uncharacterized protein LOC122077507 isoform X2 [Macadamia integrifolia]|uniref:uncharacterized protein LOC122077507 isoform X2 n=1 Tax=Macadamia integrifolia TaxID=60698 RepID=UPI001C4FD612|nr:uncharacterized protein LOC122077507 isoform X2 [Macadamia integrifolia]